MPAQELMKLATDFIKLPIHFKCEIGRELNVLDYYDGYLGDLELEEKIWSSAITESRFEEFKLLVGHYVGRSY